MTDVTQILQQIESGDPSAAEELLPLVHEELRKLASAKIALEKPGNTLQVTALVQFDTFRGSNPVLVANELRSTIFQESTSRSQKLRKERLR